MNYTFIITSTINTNLGVFTPSQRFIQSIDTLQSIVNKVPNANIVFVDNSIQPLDVKQIQQIEKYAKFIQYKHNIFSRLVNDYEPAKGMGELLMTEVALDAIIDSNNIGNRIFKLSGRYKLSDSFDINEYKNPNYFEKYAYKINAWANSKNEFETYNSIDIYFESRCWSMCSSLLQEYKTLMPNVLKIMMAANCNLELAYQKVLPHDKIIQLTKVHAEGYLSDGATIYD